MRPMTFIVNLSLNIRVDRLASSRGGSATRQQATPRSTTLASTQAAWAHCLHPPLPTWHQTGCSR